MIWTMTATRPDELLSLNDRRHRWSHAAVVKCWRKAVFFTCQRNPKPKITGFASVQLDIGTTRPNQRRDPSNWMPTAKVCVDGLTDAKFWPDDDSKRVKVLEPRFVSDIRPNQYRVTITWEDE